MRAIKGLVILSLVFAFSGCVFNSDSGEPDSDTTNTQANDYPSGEGASLSECEQAGGFVSAITECDGSQSQWCLISYKEQCYADQVKNGQCPDNFSPRVLCDGEEGGQ